MQYLQLTVVTFLKGCNKTSKELHSIEDDIQPEKLKIFTV